MKLKIELDIHRINNPKEFERTLSYDTLIQNLIFTKS
jgi:hypothetical protein